MTCHRRHHRPGGTTTCENRIVCISCGAATVVAPRRGASARERPNAVTRARRGPRPADRRQPREPDRRKSYHVVVTTATRRPTTSQATATVEGVGVRRARTAVFRLRSLVPDVRRPADGRAFPVHGRPRRRRRRCRRCETTVRTRRGTSNGSRLEVTRPGRRQAAGSGTAAGRRRSFLVVRQCFYGRTRAFYCFISSSF